MEARQLSRFHHRHRRARQPFQPQQGDVRPLRPGDHPHRLLRRDPRDRARRRRLRHRPGRLPGRAPPRGRHRPHRPQGCDPATHQPGLHQTEAARREGRHLRGLGLAAGRAPLHRRTRHAAQQGTGFRGRGEHPRGIPGHLPGRRDDGALPEGPRYHHPGTAAHPRDQPVRIRARGTHELVGLHDPVVLRPQPQIRLRQVAGRADARVPADGGRLPRGRAGDLPGRRLQPHRGGRQLGRRPEHRRIHLSWRVRRGRVLRDDGVTRAGRRRHGHLQPAQLLLTRGPAAGARLA